MITEQLTTQACVRIFGATSLGLGRIPTERIDAGMRRLASVMQEAGRGLQLLSATKSNAPSGPDTEQSSS
jgi:hypothetical protein